MRKKNVTPPQSVAGPSTMELPARDLPWAYDMAGTAEDMVAQLESVARTVSAMGSPQGIDLTLDAKDVVHIMGLFTENLERIREVLEEVRLAMEDTDLSLTQGEKTVLWDVCTTAEDGAPFDSCGWMTADKKDALENLKQARVRRPDAYLARVLYTRCRPEDERMGTGVHSQRG
jgi:hypothetical protein